MDFTESNVQSFVVKLWLEQTAEEEPPRLSHGYVTHVPSGERRYVRELGGVSEFIAERLMETGVKLGMCWRIKLWARRRRPRAAESE